jgi:predicted deacetylase
MKHKSLEELLEDYVFANAQSRNDPNNEFKTNRLNLAIRRLRAATPVFNHVATSDQQVAITVKGR